MQPKKLICSDPELAKRIYFALLSSSLKLSPIQHQKHDEFIEGLQKKDPNTLKELCMINFEKWEQEMNNARPGFLALLYKNNDLSY